MKHTLRFIFSVGLVLVCFSTQAQEITKTDSISKRTQIVGSVPQDPSPTKATLSEETNSTVNPAKVERFGLRFGVDLYKMTRSFYEPNYKGLELVGDYRLTKNYYLAAELGNENKTTDDDRLHFTTKGSFLKVGFDYNTYENWLGMRNLVYIGLRYGVSSFNQTLNSYEIYNPHPYFGEAPAIVSGAKFDGLSAHWLEAVVGVKAAVLPNVYAGFSLRLNRMVSNTKPTNFDNLYIPGFNRTHEGDFGVGFNYTVSYFLPLYKKKVTSPKVAKKN